METSNRIMQSEIQYIHEVLGQCVDNLNRMANIFVRMQ